MELLQNKVTESGLITLDLASYLIPEEECVAFDLKPYLFKELILKEKDFRESLKAIDFSEFKNKNSALYCSVDAIVPVWGYMLLASYLEPISKSIFFGTISEMNQYLLLKNIENLSVEPFRDKRMVIKGCGEIAIPAAAYVAISAKLLPVVKSLMYGEPCSTVPIFKKKKEGILL